MKTLFHTIETEICLIHYGNTLNLLDTKFQFQHYPPNFRTEGLFKTAHDFVFVQTKLTLIMENRENGLINEAPAHKSPLKGSWQLFCLWVPATLAAECATGSR